MGHLSHPPAYWEHVGVSIEGYGDGSVPHHLREVEFLTLRDYAYHPNSARTGK